MKAAPPSANYLLRKFARKHQAALTTAAAIGLILISGIAVSGWLAVRATRAEIVARQAEKEALEAQQLATKRSEGERLAKQEAIQAAAAEKAAKEQAQTR